MWPNTRWSVVSGLPRCGYQLRGGGALILDLSEPVDAREWVGEVAPTERERAPLRYVEPAPVPSNSGALRGRVRAARAAWMSTPGVEVLPPCRWCGAPTVWRGSWECDACGSRHALDPSYATSTFPRSLPVEALAGVPMAAKRAHVFSSEECDNSTERGFSEENWRSTARGEWKGAVEAFTSFKRRALAARHLARGARPTVEGPVLSPWHEARASSLAERWQRVAGCGALALMAQHEDGRCVPIEARCGDWRACHRCRAYRQWRLQRDGDVVARAARRLYAPQLSRWYTGPEGRWSERMVTLTVPHSGSIAEDARLYREAWPRFLRRLNRHFSEQRGLPKNRSKAGKELSGGRSSIVPWRRAVEVASTGEAHFHGHVWMLSPFVDQVMVHVWWGMALLESGLAECRMPMKAWDETGARDPRAHVWLGRPSEVPWPVADVRGGQMADYVGKVGLRDYVVKSDGVKEALAPVHAANAYEALSGLRVVQWAMGWSPGGETREAGWHVRRATEAEWLEWCARLSAALGVVSDGKCEAEKPSEAPKRPTEEHPWYALDGPKTATAPNDVGTVVGAEQLSLSWGRGHE